MTARRHPFFTSARGRLLSFNLLMGVVTLLVSGVAVFGFHHASQLQEQVQRQTLNDMRGSMDWRGTRRMSPRRRCACRRWWGRWSTKAKRNGCWRRSRR